MWWIVTGIIFTVIIFLVLRSASKKTQNEINVETMSNTTEKTSQISSSFGPQFAAPQEFVEKGFFIIFDGVVMDEAEKQALFETFSSIIPDGNSREEEKLFQKYLMGKEWSWSWFDEWKDRFLEHNIWPQMWLGYAKGLAMKDPEKKRKKLEREKIKILLHTTSKVIYSLRNLSRDRKGFEGSRFLREKYHFRLYCPFDSDKDIIMMFFPDIFDRVLADDFARIPPYFPGDQSSIGMRKNTDS